MGLIPFDFVTTFFLNAYQQIHPDDVYYTQGEQVKKPSFIP